MRPTTLKEAADMLEAAEAQVEEAHDALILAQLDQQVLRRKLSRVPMRIDLSYSLEERADPDVMCPK